MESYSKFWTNVMSTRVKVVGEGTEDLSQSGEMISEGRTSYYNYRPSQDQDHSDLAENYTDFISILEDYRATDNEDDDGIIDKKLIRGSLDLANPDMKDDNQVRTVIRYFGLPPPHLVIFSSLKARNI